MQREIDTEAAGTQGLPVKILGVNDVGQESGNSLIVAGRTLPWLQDVVQQSVWSSRWHVDWRDVFVLDPQNRKITVYNLTVHDLASPANYQELKSILKAAAAP
jgi:hypothetical protein